MRRYRRSAIVGLAALLACGALLAHGETIITSSGSVLQGTVEFGIPAVVSVTSATGDVFTVQRTNLKSLRFPEEEGGDVTVETFDGNILIGTLGGVPEVIGLKTASGDVQSVKLSSIVEIRFEQPAEAAAEAPTTGPAPAAPKTPSATRDVEGLVAGVVELHETTRGGILIGLDSGMQVGFTSKSGLGVPRWTLGFNFLLLGFGWRTYFGPSANRVEEAALELAGEDPTLDLEDLTDAVRAEVTPFMLPYFHVGTNSLILPEIGGGVLLHLGRAFYIDLGATIDILGLPWLSVGLQIVL
jgi:hypothetical protein